MKNIQIDDGLFIDKEFCNKNMDADIFPGNGKIYYRAKDLIRAWSRYEIELKKIRKISIKK